MSTRSRRKSEVFRCQSSRGKFSIVPSGAKQPGVGPPLGYRLRLNRVYKALETRLFVRAGGEPRLGRGLTRGPGSRRAPRRWRQGDPYLARGPEKGLLRRPFSTNGGSWASSKIISDSESFVRSLARPFVQASMYSDSFSRARYECHRVHFLRAEPLSPSRGPLSVRAELTIGRVRYAHRSAGVRNDRD